MQERKKESYYDKLFAVLDIQVRESFSNEVIYHLLYNIFLSNFSISFYVMRTL